MFDMPAFADTTRLSNDLPDVEEVPQKERLEWEKELVGAYISDHPLSRVWPSLESTITTLSGQIDETLAERSVTVAGLVSYVRPHTTKKGSAMAFAQIEDLQGPIELVIFPSIWEKTKDLWQREHILVVRGKVSFRGKNPSVLVDSATNQITTVEFKEPPVPAAVTPRQLKHVQVVVPRSEDMEWVIQSLGQVYDLLQTHPGDDEFSIFVENGAQGQVQLDFPNDTTGHSQDLERALRGILGPGTVRVSPIQRGF
jgi:DNA polymerase-3 subunit alpha